MGLIAFDQGIDTLHEDPSRKMVRRMISSVAEWEREIIVIRVVEGVDKAQKVGTRSGRPFGRPVRGTEIKGPKKKPITEEDIRAIFAEDPKITIKGLASRLEVPRSTLYVYLDRFGGVNKLRGTLLISEASKSDGADKLQFSGTSAEDLVSTEEAPLEVPVSEDLRKGQVDRHFSER